MTHAWSLGCVIGRACEKHGGAMHGQEAEELRVGVEQILASRADYPEDDASPALCEMRRALRRLLDRTDARDSLSFLEISEEDVRASAQQSCEQGRFASREFVARWVRQAVEQPSAGLVEHMLFAHEMGYLRGQLDATRTETAAMREKLSCLRGQAAGMPAGTSLLAEGGRLSDRPQAAEACKEEDDADTDHE